MCMYTITYIYIYKDIYIYLWIYIYKLAFAHVRVCSPFVACTHTYSPCAWAICIERYLYDINTWYQVISCECIERKTWYQDMICLAHEMSWYHILISHMIWHMIWHIRTWDVLISCLDIKTSRVYIYALSARHDIKTWYVSRDIKTWYQDISCIWYQHTYAGFHMCMNIYIYTQYIYVHKHVYVYTYKHVHTYVHVCTCKRMYIYMYLCVYIRGRRDQRSKGDHETTGAP